MTLIQCNVHSKYLNMDTSITVIIPSYLNINNKKKPLSEVYNPNTKFKTLYLLHGATGDHTTWLRHSSIERYALKRQLAVVMPSAYNSSYTNMVHGLEYFSFLSEELPLICRALFPLSDKREDNFVAGLSMGGRGAFHWALKRPDFFAAAASLSGSLNIDEMVERCSKNDDPISVKRFLNAYGDFSKIRGSDNDIYALAKKLVDSKIDPPKLYIACGTEDIRYLEQHKPFVAYAEKIGLDLFHEEGPGDHDFDFWDPFIEKVINWLPMPPEQIN